MYRSVARIALIGCLLLGVLRVQAIDNIQFQIGHWAFEEYASEQFDLSLSLAESGFKFTATAENLSLPAPWGVLQKVRLSCDQTRLSSGAWQCQSGRLQFQHARLGPQSLNFKFKANTEEQQYHLDLTGLKLAQGELNMTADYGPAGWNLDLDAEGLSLAALSPWLSSVLSEEQMALLAEWDYQGRLSLNTRIQGKAEQLHSLDVDWRLNALNFSNQSGTQVAEGVRLKGQFKGDLQQTQWHWETALQSDNGQAYIDPVFLDFKQHPLAVSGQGLLDKPLTRIQIRDLKLEQQEVIAADVSLAWQEGGLASLHITTKPADLKYLYPVWLQPFALGTAAAKLQLDGQAAMKLDWRPGGYQLQLDFEQASVSDDEERFSLQNLNGKLGWSNTETRLKTDVSWDKARIYALDLGPAAIEAYSVNNGLELTEMLDLPVLDGSLQINAFNLQQQADGLVEWHFDGLLTPISMESLSQALGWPRLHGKLSGMIPRVSYSQQQLKIDGALQVKVFDGTAVIRDLRLLSPLGSLPQLYANIDISDLDLALLTRAFDFGRISGRLEGHVHQLRLSNWEPVQFDAMLATAEDNPGKRRISQKAVDNLTQIGGGATGMLSRSFLRFFEDFSYQKLGLSCRLHNEVCEMSGIEEAEQGYYIVKGGGGLPPWINVIGYTRRVDWADLITRLLAVRDSSGPVIQ